MQGGGEGGLCGRAHVAVGVRAAEVRQRRKHVFRLCHQPRAEAPRLQAHQAGFVICSIKYSFMSISSSTCI